MKGNNEGGEADEEKRNMKAKMGGLGWRRRGSEAGSSRGRVASVNKEQGIVWVGGGDEEQEVQEGAVGRRGERGVRCGRNE